VVPEAVINVVTQVFIEAPRLHAHYTFSSSC
jgi:hypothetical protein